MQPFAALIAMGLLATSTGNLDIKQSTARSDCLQEARQGGSPGGSTVTEAEKTACNALPDVDIDDKT